MPRKTSKSAKPSAKVPAGKRRAASLAQSADDLEISSLEGSDGELAIAASPEENPDGGDQLEPREDASLHGGSNHDYDDSDEGSLPRSRPQSRPQSRVHSRAQSPVSSPAVSGKQSSAVLSGQQSSNTAGGEKAPRRESVLEEMQSGTADHGDDAAQTISDSDSDCKVTGTSQVTILSGDTAGPTRQSEDDVNFTAKVNFQSLPDARPASPAESHKRVTREHSHSPPRTNKKADGGGTTPLAKSDGLAAASVYASGTSTQDHAQTTPKESASHTESAPPPAAKPRLSAGGGEAAKPHVPARVGEVVLTQAAF